MVIKYNVNTVNSEGINDVELTNSTKEDKVHRRKELDTQRALDETGFGKFNYKIVVVTGLICTNVSFSLTTVGFILPSAVCDFNMNTIDKSHLSTSPMFGMACGACLWGCIADTKGRRISLLNSLFLQSLAEVAASIVSNYWGLLVLKFSSGFALSGQLAVLYTYVGEFQPTKYREKTLSLMEFSWILGIILTPILGWLMIPLDIQFTSSGFSFKSWNLFVLVSGIPAFLVGCGLSRLPETPKYLAVSGRYTDLRNVLTAMYCENTGNAPEEYTAKLDKMGIMFFADSNKGLVDEANGNYGYRISTMSSFHQIFKTLYQQTKILFMPPYLVRTLITSLDSYCILSSFYSLMLWFPELFKRFADYEEKYPGVRATICTVSGFDPQTERSNATTANLSLLLEQIATGISNHSAMVECSSVIDTQVYWHILMLGLACVPVAIIFPLCIDRLGFRFFLVFSTFSCAVVTIGMIFVTNSTQNLILSCIHETLVSTSGTVILCLAVQLFPTNLRVTASVFFSLFSRAGALIGNTMFGYLIDDHCYVLISIITVQLFVAGFLGLFIPKDSQIAIEKEQQVNSEIQQIGDSFHAGTYSPAHEPPPKIK